MVESLLRELHSRLQRPRTTDGFSTEVFLHGLGDIDQESELAAAQCIERLCKKAEVPKRLLLEYSGDLSVSVGMTPVTPEYAKFFALLLIVLAEEQADLKYLNCALKLLDGFLLAPKIVFRGLEREYADQAVERMLAAVS